ncbi:methionine adenosyltransferase [Peptoniphilus sp. MSJ-1]|uniref:S-adenosylmethionine synthase n=1 Tax=Peptoniphilus ovalis TaxID=2841503 RepID=A0ABS6FKH5_9FIRM|nr:methionine adenosyltransferase [Peptoniphilus ovalis]MBU5669766.1 methionine adenosyltransferase [Peptoniphilus ovalis]
MNKFIITSESVTEGHPDKVCDLVSDSILDEYLKKDSNSRVAIESMISNNLLLLAGEVTSKAKVDVEKVAIDTIKEIGYSNDESGFDVDKAIVITNIDEQSKDIAMGVNREKICAGDQGLVFGYATRESNSYLPLSCELSHKLAKRLSVVRKEGIVDGLFPDGKSQVSIVYENNKPSYVKSIVLAAHHKESKDIATLRYELIKEVIFKEIDNSLLKKDTSIHINATGKFTIGGPRADVGLTGRKIIVDTYGGLGRHGGGAYSGKDPSKADRSASYMARYVAKNVVAANLCDRCEVQLAYVIGKENPESIYINTFGTEKYDLKKIYDVVNSVFDFSIDSIIKNLRLQRPIYKKTAAYGHFGREESEFTWEKIDKKDEIKNLIG